MSIRKEIENQKRLLENKTIYYSCKYIIIYIYIIAKQMEEGKCSTLRKKKNHHIGDQME